MKISHLRIVTRAVLLIATVTTAAWSMVVMPPRPPFKAYAPDREAVIVLHNWLRWENKYLTNMHSECSADLTDIVLNNQGRLDSGVYTRTTNGMYKLSWDFENKAPSLFGLVRVDFSPNSRYAMFLYDHQTWSSANSYRSRTEIAICDIKDHRLRRGITTWSHRPKAPEVEAQLGVAQELNKEEESIRDPALKQEAKARFVEAAKRYEALCLYQFDLAGKCYIDLDRVDISDKGVAVLPTTAGETIIFSVESGLVSADWLTRKQLMQKFGLSEIPDNPPYRSSNRLLR